MSIISRNSNQFVWCSYWGTWNRLLSPYTPEIGQIEVNLTAINPLSESDWETRVKRIWIRAHRTVKNARDLITWELPDHVVETMKKHLPEPLIERLLHEDFLPQIDWQRYRQHCNGGAPFNLIRRNYWNNKLGD